MGRHASVHPSALQNSILLGWYFDCICGASGENYSDHKRSIQCDVCKRWMHCKCNAVPTKEKDLLHYFTKFIWICPHCKAGDYKYKGEYWKQNNSTPKINRIVKFHPDIPNADHHKEITICTHQTHHAAKLEEISKLIADLDCCSDCSSESETARYHRNKRPVKEQHQHSEHHEHHYHHCHINHVYKRIGIQDNSTLQNRSVPNLKLKPSGSILKLTPANSATSSPQTEATVMKPHKKSNISRAIHVAKHVYLDHIYNSEL